MTLGPEYCDYTYYVVVFIQMKSIPSNQSPDSMHMAKLFNVGFVFLQYSYVKNLHFVSLKFTIPKTSPGVDQDEPVRLDLEMPRTIGHWGEAKQLNWMRELELFRIPRPWLLWLELDMDSGLNY